MSLYFARVPGSLKQISVSDSTILGVNEDDNIYKARNISFTDDGRIHLNWEQIDGKLTQISVFEFNIGTWHVLHAIILVRKTLSGFYIG